MKHKAVRARFWLEELMFGKSNVGTLAFCGVNEIGHIDTLLRPCALRACDGIGPQETERDGTSKTVASEYRVHFSGDCSGAKGSK